MRNLPGFETLKSLLRAVVPNMINPDDPPSISQLLQLLEWQLDKHIDDNRYVSPITISPNIQGAN